MMGQEREKQATQQSSKRLVIWRRAWLIKLDVENVLAILDQQRNDNEMLLRALATGKYQPIQ